MSHLALHILLQEICRKGRSVRQDILIRLPGLGTADQGRCYGNH